MAGAPKGNTNASKGKRWAEAIDKAIKQYTDKKRKIEAGQALDRLAHNLVKTAFEGDVWAYQEIGNRLDGKAPQSIDVSGSIEHKHVHELTDDEINARLEQLERERAAAGAADPQEGESTLN